MAMLLCVILVFLFLGCARKHPSLCGRWESVAISNPAPFFKGVLPDNTRGSMTAAFSPGGGFTWEDRRNGTRFTGTYRADEAVLVLTAVGEPSPIRMTCGIAGERLTLATDDGFTIVMTRTASCR